MDEMDWKKRGRLLVEVVNFDLWNATPNPWTLCRIRADLRELGIPSPDADAFAQRMIRYFGKRERGREASLFLELFGAKLTDEIRQVLTLSYGGVTPEPERIERIAAQTAPLVGLFESEFRQVLQSLYRLPFHATTDHFPFVRIRYEILRVIGRTRKEAEQDQIRDLLDLIDPEGTGPEKGVTLSLQRSLTQAELDWLLEVEKRAKQPGLLSFPRLKGTGPKSDQEHHPEIQRLLALTRKFNVRVLKGPAIDPETEAKVRELVEGECLRIRKSL
jgi:hypothetical protein